MDYFKSEADKVAFALLECTGEMRKKLLGITPFWYHNKSYQEKEKQKLMLLLQNHPRKTDALMALNELF